MGVKEILEDNKVPLPKDFDKRFDLILKGLRKSPDFESELESFKAQTGGGLDEPPIPQDVKLPDIESEDWLGPQIVSFLDVITSPAARGILKMFFMVIFFMSYLESIPVFGSILSAALDIMTAGTKITIKTIQKNIPPALGLLPIPYASLVGMIISALLGAILWPMVAAVSLSRQDFAVAIESYLRVIPPPLGDTIADMFMDANRTIAKLDNKRQKLVNDIVNAITVVTDAIGEVSETISRATSGAQSLVAQNPMTSLQNAIPLAQPVPTAPEVEPAVPTAPEVEPVIQQQQVKTEDPFKDPPREPVSMKPSFKTAFKPLPTAGTRKRLSKNKNKVNKWTIRKPTKFARR